MLKVAGVVSVKVGLLNALRDHFSTKTRFERIQQVFVAFNSDLDSLEKQSAQNTNKIQAIEERLQSPKFTEAVLTVAEEAVRTADSEKLRRLASTLANGLDPEIVKPSDDLSSFIRDVSQLSEHDIKTLDSIARMRQMLWLRYESEPTTPGNFPVIEEYLEADAANKIEGDDFYSAAYRLVGFGLALELPSKTGRRSSKNIRFTITNRGRKLLALLTLRSQ